MKTCLDCCNFSEDGPDGFCKVANHPSVKRYTSDPANYRNADMSACPGFREDK